MLRHCLVLAAGLLATLTLVSHVGAEDRPNVLFIAVDDLNDWISCLGGHPDARTPNIDRLAQRGVLFTRSYCAAPACNPSRAALMTGIRPSTSGVYHNSQSWRKAMPDVATLPQHFMKHGYKALGCGKIYHGRFPDPASWDEYLSKTKDPKPAQEVLDDPHSRAGTIVWGVLDIADEKMDDYKMVSWAIDVLQQKHEQPLFLACGIFRPHMPWQVPRKYYDMFPLDEISLPKTLKNDLDDIPPAGQQVARQNDHRNILDTDNWKHAVQAYLASMAFADAQVGRLMDAFEASDYADNTIVILWGDHGWHLGEKRHWRKFALWEEATRAPLMIAAPGVTQAGQVCERPVDFMHIYPTLAELCGLPIPEQAEGRSMLPLLKDAEAEWDQPAVTTHGRNSHAVRSEQFRYIRYADGSEELYDHEADPMEWNNLAGDEKYQGVKDELAAWLPKVNVKDAAHAQKGRGKGKKRNRR